MRIAQQNVRFRASDDQYQKYQQMETEDVVHHTEPDGVQYVKQLNEDANKWQNAAHYNAGNWMRANRFVGYLVWNCI